MPKVSIDKSDFYKNVIEMVKHARKSAYFYSISCCWGFYSYGVRNFEHVMTAFRECAGTRWMGQHVDVRVLVRIDADNPIDVFAADCLATMQANLARYISPGETPNLVRELIEPARIQFLIVDDQQVLSTHMQYDNFNRELGLALNVSESGSRFEKEDDLEEYHRLGKLFEAGDPAGIE